MFKKAFKFFAFACMACVALTTITACGDDDDPTPSKKKTATEVTVAPTFYTTALTLKYFKVEVTDGDGNTIELTTENTKEVNSFPMAFYALLLEPKSANDTYRVYTGAKSTYKSFPVEKKYVMTTTPRSLTPTESFNFIASPVLELTNDAQESDLKIDKLTSVVTTSISAKNWDSYIERYPKKIATLSMTLTDASRGKISGLAITKE